MTAIETGMIVGILSLALFQAINEYHIDELKKDVEGLKKELKIDNK